MKHMQYELGLILKLLLNDSIYNWMNFTARLQFLSRFFGKVVQQLYMCQKHRVGDRRTIVQIKLIWTMTENNNNIYYFIFKDERIEFFFPIKWFIYLFIWS